MPNYHEALHPRRDAGTLLQTVLLVCSVMVLLLSLATVTGMVERDGFGPIPLGVATVLGLLGAYAFGIRPRLVRWGATEEEVSGPYPGADLIPGTQRGSTTAVTIDAPPSMVWPWLVQMGVDRAVWYTWDYWRPWGRRSAERIHPEWQDISVGYRMPATLDGSAWWEVAAIEPERFLALRMSVDLRGRRFDPRGPRPRFYTDSIWSFLLNRLPGERTSLVVSGYWDFRPRWLKGLVGFFLLEPSTWIMQTRQNTGLKRRAERAAKLKRPSHGAHARFKAHAAL